jgi:hypothetical protein
MLIRLRRPEPPKNQRKEGGKFPARFAMRAKTEANLWKTVTLFVRFLKRKPCALRQVKRFRGCGYEIPLDRVV